MFYNVSPDRVRIEITVSNPSREQSRRTPLRLQAAPLGVFLPWQDLTTLWVPPLGPGEVVKLATEVSSPTPRSLGQFDQVPPRRLLTALGLFDDDEQDSPVDRRGETLARTPHRRADGNESGAKREANAALPPDIMRLLGRRGSLHWAGNVNVLMGEGAVERHLAQALRIYPGLENHAMLIVASKGRNAYAFELHGDGAAWDVQLHAFAASVSGDGDLPFWEIGCGQWYDVAGYFIVDLLIQTPVVCERGEVQVHVTRKSTGKTAIVEFDLDPSVQEAGCYAV